MYKWIIGSIIGLSLVASFAVIKFGLKPKPIPIIKPSNFEEPERLGNYIHRQLYQRLITASPIIFGFDPSNPYETKVVSTIMNLVVTDLGEKAPVFIQTNPKESFHSNRGEKTLAFSFVNLRGVQEADEIINCESNHTYEIWLDCMKRQKVRQINRARKIDVKKPVGIVETQSQRDILIYIRE